MPEKRLQRTRVSYQDMDRLFRQATSTSLKGQPAQRFADEWIALELAYIAQVEADNHANASD